MRNFRIIKTKLAEEYTYGVAEVYYNEEDENKPAMHTDYIDGLFASEEELLEHFKMIVEDIERCIQHKGTLIAREEDREWTVRSNKEMIADDIQLSDFQL